MSELLDQVVSGIEPEAPVTHGQLRSAMVLVESLVSRVDALEVRVTEQEKRPTVKSRAEYMRKYRAKKEPSVLESSGSIGSTDIGVSAVNFVSDTPPA